MLTVWVQVFRMCVYHGIFLLFLNFSWKSLAIPQEIKEIFIALHLSKNLATWF